ncbi:GntR family transcriptional regulator [Actinomadura verrucosospora]|uniref:GntR family transcriptional regulator n=1 Tax=Actinomadura verrucosospora TaxID=46165 RepID=A0A7D3VPS0_ACTVE|nr:GntR family transcriptional regulator [Actinomadura verrucosospora]QKG19019.1 GntR family transcriptional regulator [Actinomadura verrucosospora]
MDGTSPREGSGGWVSSRPRAERARQAADVLRQQITGGAFPGGTLPDERELGERLGASRNAVREALALLRAEGLITRRRGVGTTVVAAKHGHGLDRLAGLAEALTGHGTVTNEVREFGRVPVPPPVVAARLGLPPGAGAVRVERLRRLEDEPLSLDTTYLPGDIGEGLLRRPGIGRELAERDLFGLIEEVAGQPLGRAEVQVHAVAAAPATAAPLGIPAGSAIFAIDRLAHLADGRPVDSEAVHIRADRLTLRATLYRTAAPPGA